MQQRVSFVCKNSFSRGRSFFLKSILFAIGRYSRANWFISLSLKYPSYLIPSGLIIVKGHVCIWSYAVPTHVTEHGCPRYFLSGSLRTISFAIVLQNALFSVSPLLSAQNCVNNAWRDIVLGSNLCNWNIRMRLHICYDFLVAFNYLRTAQS